MTRRSRRLRSCGKLIFHLALLVSPTCTCPLDGARTAPSEQGQRQREPSSQIVDGICHGQAEQQVQARSLLRAGHQEPAQDSRQQRAHHQHHHHHHHNSHGADPTTGLLLCGAKNPSRSDQIRLGLAHAKYDRNNPDDEDEHGRYAFRSLAVNGANQNSTLVDYVIPVRFNIFIKNQTFGRLTLNQLRTTLMANMRKAFNGTGFRFKIQSVLHFVNATWAACKDEETFKPKTHVGGPETLTVWICDLASTGVAGTSYYPPIVMSDPKWDGISLMNPALGMSEFATQAFTHELGHWLGLLHTFEGGCSLKPVYKFDKYSDYYFIGDGVSDTPSHANWTWLYPSKSECWRNDSLDTCATRSGLDPGLDPVDNYMNYLPGNCFRDYGRFTAGQRKRMRAQWFKWRDPKTRKYKS